MKHLELFFREAIRIEQIIAKGRTVIGIIKHLQKSVRDS